MHRRWQEGATANDIGRELFATRSAIIGMITRMRKRGHYFEERQTKAKTGEPAAEVKAASRVWSPADDHPPAPEFETVQRGPIFEVPLYGGQIGWPPDVELEAREPGVPFDRYAHKVQCAWPLWADALKGGNVCGVGVHTNRDGSKSPYCKDHHRRAYPVVPMGGASKR